MLIPKNLIRSAPRRLFRVREIPLLEEFSFLTISSLRHLIYESEPRKSASGVVIPGNGLKESGAIVRIGKKILIDIVKLRSFFGITDAIQKTDDTEMDIR